MSILSSIIGEVGEAAQLGLRGGGESVLDARSTVLKNIAESRAAREAHHQAMARARSMEDKYGRKFAMKGDITLGGITVRMPGNASMPKSHFKGLDSTIRGLSRDYPSVAEGIDRIGISGFKGDDFLRADRIGEATLMGPGTSESIKPSIALAYDKIVADTANAISHGSIDSMDNPLKGIMDHEFGHHVHDLLSPAWASQNKEMSGGLALSMFDSFGVLKSAPSDIMDQSTNFLGVTTRSDAMNESLNALGDIIRSPYGKTDTREAFAESFRRLRQNISNPGLQKFSDMIDAGLSGEVRYDDAVFQRIAKSAESGGRYNPVEPLSMAENQRLAGKPKLQHVRPVFDRKAPSPILRDHAIRDITDYQAARAAAQAADDQFL